MTRPDDARARADLACILDREGRFVSLDDGWAAQLGARGDALRRDGLLAFVHEDDRAGFLIRLAETCETRRPTRIELRCRAGAAGWRTLDVVATAGADDGHVAALARDVTDDIRRRDHAAMVEEITGAGNWEIDVAAGTLFWSPSLYRLFGLDPATHVPTVEGALSLFPATGEAGVQSALRRLLLSGESFDLECPFTTAQGRVRHGRVVGRAEMNGNRVVRAFGALVETGGDQGARDREDAAHRRLQAAVEALPHSFILFDAQDRIVVCNEWQRRLYPGTDDLLRPGTTFEELARRSLALGQIPAAIGREEEWLAERMAAHRQPSSSLEQYHDDGRCLHIVERETADGDRVGLRIDVTDIKRQEQRLAGIIAATNVGTWEYDLVSGQRVYNARWAEIVGLELDEIADPHSVWAAIAHPDDRARAEAGVAAHLRGETPFYEQEVRLRHEDGRWVWVLDSGRVTSRALDGTPLRLSGTHLDITERKQAEEELRAFKDMIAHAAEGVWVLDPRGRTTYVNDSMASMLGCSVEALLGRSFLDFIDEDRRGGALEQLLEHADSERGHNECRFRRADGRAIWTSVSVRSRRDSAGELVSAVALVTDITERRAAENLIRSQAREDGLTGLANRAALMHELERHTISRRASDRVTAFVLLDLDHFKEVNDTHGHVVGDALLQAVAGRLRAGVRASDVVARLGGDEFALVLSGFERADDLEPVIEGLMRRIREPIDLEGRTVTPSMSVGVAIVEEGLGVEDVYRNADSALYISKGGGRNTWTAFDDALSERIARRRSVAAILGSAVAARALDVVFEPQIRLLTGEHFGFEVSAFLPAHDEMALGRGEYEIAEETGHMVALGDLVIERALAQAARLVDADLDPGRIALDVTLTQLRDRGFPARIAAMLQRFGLCASRLAFETTEDVLLDRVGSVGLQGLQDLVGLGATVCLDDFGSGLASISHLRRATLGELKLAGPIVAALGARDDTGRVAATLIDLAHNLRLAAAATAVITQAQFDALSSAGCDIAQGALISPPLRDHDAIEAYLASRDFLRTRDAVFLL